MKITLIYVIAQIIVIIGYIFLAMTYFLKDRKNIILANFLSLLAAGISFLLLSAYTGLSMVLVAIIRNIIFLFEDKENKRNIVVLIVLLFISTCFAYFTYNGFLSLLAVFATMLYTYALWQKNPKLYKILGIPVSLLGIFYNIYILSIFGTILEGIILLVSAVSTMIDYRKKLIKER